MVTWISPNHAVDDIHMQFPAIRIKRKYYSISLRMMKAIWRHIRLSPTFVNREVSKDGRIRLRIPEKLLLEKKRTQRRFNVSYYS